MREKGNAERQTEMKRADVPPQRRRRREEETGREGGRRVRKENKGKGDHAPQREEEGRKIYFGPSEDRDSFPFEVEVEHGEVRRDTV